ncbi:MAG: ATP-dependent zinc metalloprotease FtsH [Cyanobacteria bacterium SZAS LIN-3]|nr:ATP-dependent zinc metalloprotease FtsH [Cyanobacteria bacterium SZAS LIN-3]
MDNCSTLEAVSCLLAVRTKFPRGLALTELPPEKNGPKSSYSYLDQFFWFAIITFWLVIIMTNALTVNKIETLPYSAFVNDSINGAVDNLVVSEHEITGNLKVPVNGAKKFRTFRLEDPQLIPRLTEHKIAFSGDNEGAWWKEVVPWITSIFTFILIWTIFLGLARRGGGEGGGPGFGLMSFEKSKAKVYMERVKTTFKDVAGVDEAKEELQEIIGFLKEPARYNRLGGHMPKGILLVGPPGTGKTLIARAIAGEANVPFFSISGSEFVEMFVGVGAARVRDLFTQAQKNAPCIVFIDELDALGRARGLGPVAGGHDEKEQTLNQLLVEMDGFDTRQGIILLAATNRPEILDSALLRAGRFDRQILIDRPDKVARLQILNVYMKNVVSSGCDWLDDIAAATTGFTGADLANLVNEAVLLATREGADSVRHQDFIAALERIVGGLEKKSRLLNAKERRVVAFHEIGHALVALSLKGTDPIQKISIIPRGVGALGYTMQRPTEDRFLMSREELTNKLTVLLGGRAAELLVFEDISTGAADDLLKATDIARSMAMRYGMVKSLGPVAYEAEHAAFLAENQMSYTEGARFSPETAREIELAVRELINSALVRATDILKGRRAELQEAAELLLDKETLVQEDLAKYAAAPAELILQKLMIS